MTILKRLAFIIVAYALASLVTGYVVWASLFFDPAKYGGTGYGGTGFSSPGFGLFICLMVAWFSAAPAAIVVALGEALKWRMWWYYSAAGSLIGLCLGSVFQPPPFFPWLGLGFGIVSGGIYWLIAGRRAGPDDDFARKAVAITCCLVAVGVAVGMSANVLPR